MGLFNKTSWKFLGMFATIVAASLVIVYTAVFFSPEARENRAANKYIEDLQKQYANDTYGGETPEETLAFFIEALEVGDIELASKYFVVEKQGEWLENLKKIQENGLFDSMLFDLSREKHRHIISDRQVNFSIANDEGMIALTILLSLEANEKWKIDEL